MILFIDAQGNQLKTIPEKIYQGSNNANSIIVVAPLASSLVAEIRLKLPTGYIYRTGVSIAGESITENNTILNTWEFKINSVLTQYYGEVEYQITFTNGQGERIASCRSSINVERGVPPYITIDEEDTTYDTILQAIAQIQETLLNGVNSAFSVKPYNAEVTYSQNVYVFNDVNGELSIYKSLQDGNVGNELSDTEYWQLLSEFITEAQVNSLINSAIASHNSNPSAHSGIQTNLRNDMDSKISEHNQNESAHTNIRNSLKDYTDNSINNHNINASSHQTIQNNLMTYADNKILNSYSSLRDKTYSANYQNRNFAPISYVSNLYASKTPTPGSFILTNEPPRLDNNNIYTKSSVNDDFDYSAPELILIRPLSATTTIGLNNSFEIDLQFSLDRDETLSFAGRIEYSTDNGTTWVAMSTNQATSSELWQGSSGGTIYGNTVRFNIQTDLVTNEITLYRDMFIRVLIFKKQNNTSALETTYYFGVLVDSTRIYTFIKFNFSNVYISSNQIANGSITYPKLSPDLRQRIDEAGSVKFEMHTISSWNDNSGGSDVFIYSNSFDLIDTPSETTIVELVNDNAESFAEYGFSILRVVNKNVLIGATKEPIYPVTFKILTYNATQKTEPLPDEPEISIVSNILTVTNASSYPEGTYFDVYAQKQGSSEVQYIDTAYPLGTQDPVTVDLHNCIMFAGTYQIAVKANVSGVYSGYSEAINYTMQAGLYNYGYNDQTDSNELTLIESWENLITNEEVVVNNNVLINVTLGTHSGANRLVIANDVYEITHCLTDMQQVCIPAETTIIGNEAFSGSDTEMFYWEDNGQILSLGTGIFKNTSVINVMNMPLSASVIIPSETYMNCQQLSGIDFNYSTTTLGERAFKNTILNDFLEIYAFNITDIESNCFENCNLTDIYLSTDLTYIGAYAFKGCTLTIHFTGDSTQWANITKSADWDTNATITMSYNDNGQGGN